MEFRVYRSVDNQGVWVTQGIQGKATANILDGLIQSRKVHSCFKKKTNRTPLSLRLRDKPLRSQEWYWYSAIKSCSTLCDSMDCSTPGFPVLPYLLGFAQTPLNRWCHPTVSSSATLFSFCFNLSQSQGLFPGVGSSYQQVGSCLVLHSSVVFGENEWSFYSLKMIRKLLFSYSKHTRQLEIIWWI